MRRKRYFDLIVIAMILIGFCGGAFGGINDGLVAHWEFEEGEGNTAYDSAGSNDGAVNGAVWVEGEIGDYALDFNGDDYIDVPDDASLNVGVITISAWIYPERDDDMTIVDKPGIPSEGKHYQYMFRVWDEVTRGLAFELSINGNRNVWVMSHVVNLNEWNYVVATYDGTDARFYVNGIDVGTTRHTGSDTGDIDVYNNNLRIGELTNITSWGDFFGTIDDVRIYDRALSASEIEELYLYESPALEGLEIDGPNEVVEDSQVHYRAIAHYDNGNSQDVTGLVEWFSWPEEIGSIDENGVLSTKILNTPEAQITVYAAYAEGDIEVDAEKQVKVLSMCPAGGSALDFDGVDDFVLVPRSLLLEPSEEITIEMWAFLDSKQTKNTRLLRKAGIYGNGYLFAADQGNDERMQLRIDDNGTTMVADTKSHTEYVGSWHHFAGVYDATSAEFYVDGVQVSTVSHNKGGMTHNPLTDLYIGHGAPGPNPSEHYKGKLDEVRIWEIALSQKQIRANMHRRLSGNEDGLVAYWNFDEGHGQIAHDSSGNGNDGQLGVSSEVDDSDPNWVEPGAPRVCSVPQIMRRNLHGAIALKQHAMKDIHEALQKEIATLRMLYRIVRNKDYGLLKKIHLFNARKHIFGAIIKEFRARYQLRKSIEELRAALRALNGEIRPEDKPERPERPEPHERRGRDR